jgi:hypothetical protein
MKRIFADRTSKIDASGIRQAFEIDYWANRITRDVSVHAINMAFLCHCEAFRPKQSQSFNDIRLLRFARSDKNAVFP